jgi:uncharacterized protein (TIRG00374 family)
MSPADSVDGPVRSHTTLIIKWIFKLGLLGGILGYLAYKRSLQARDLIALLLHWPWVVLALVLYLAVVVFSAVRYKLLLQALDISVRLKDVLAVSMIGLFFDLASPVASGGDLVKAFYVNRLVRIADGKSEMGLLVMSVVLDRIMGFFALFVLGLAVSMLAWPQIQGEANLRRLTVVFAAVCTVSLLCFIVLVSEKLENSPLRKRWMHWMPFHEKIESIYTGFAGLRHHRPMMLKMLALSVLNHVVGCIIILLLAQGMTFTSVKTGAPVNLEIVPCLTVLPVGFFLNTFGMAGGFGVGNLAFEELFRRVLGIDGGARLAMGFQIVGVLLRLLGVPVLLLYRRNAPDVPPQPQP